MAGENQKGTGGRKRRKPASPAAAPGDRAARPDRLDRRALPPLPANRPHPPKSPPPPPPPRRPGGGRRRGLAYWLAVVGLWGAIATGILVAWFAWDLPSMSRLDEIDRRPAVRLVSADGTVFATVGDLYGEAMALADYPDVLVKAVLAIEDRRFFDHGGFDPIGILRALYHNVVTGSVSQGGSTISQQTVKTIFLTPERSIRRKVQEAILTVQLERRLTKPQILSLYMNRVYLGSGAYGMDGAARRYFGHPARRMSLAEAAMLAGLMKAPSRYSPLADYEAAKARAAVVLDAMADAEFITADQAAAAKALPARLAARPVSNDARYFVDWVVEQVADFAGPEIGDITVYTTLDLRLQRAAEGALDAGLDGEGLRLDAGQGALVALAPDGAVRALVGGRDYGASPFNRAVRALRQPGSAFKLFVYLAALEAGFEPGTLVNDAPVDVAGYRPTNFEPGYAGEISLVNAFARSLNTVSVRLLVRVGARKVVAMAKRLGITSAIPANASIALGSAEVTPLELTGAYAVLANGGRRADPYAIREVRSADGDIVFRRDTGGGERLLSEQVVGRMNRLLAAVIDYGSGKAARLGRPAGGKTGTSQDYRNAWFVGITGQLVATVWIGNDDGTPMIKATGGGLPAQIWKAFMTEALTGTAALPLPDAPSDEDRGLLDDLVEFLGGGPGGLVVEDPMAGGPPARYR
ncbi:transglycosylase domain-containing protein [Zavarzinia compransoris]|uniref:Carboxypeptidase n=1 Tax=Zavarzinia compransoris TaxID=1264899 RepID=A0A317E0G7_9PROT|nr:PBP1A family penicillin-binding protein [Zavarzinia compransoris]PWR20469.1 carboxypeptidase [Zavarzinia compransoris]TDP43888.1 penicillin-binding protein 1A [Zavarzinia compransoris]